MKPCLPLARQRGVVLAMALMFLALLTATAAVAPAVANLELSRAGALDAWSRANAAASAGLADALATGDLATTIPGVIVAGGSPGAGYTVTGEFLGFRAGSGESSAAGLVEWHFRMTAVGMAGRGAQAVQALDVVLLAPEPPDRDACIADGCPVPPICPGAPPCEPDLRYPPAPVGWHLPEDGP